MVRIAKKFRSVKRANSSKAVAKSKTPPRYTIRKDSLGRRYAIDKRTGQRVSVYVAEKERATRKKKAAQLFHGIQPPKRKSTRKKAVPSSQRKKRSEAAKKGWETRRQKLVPPPSAPILFEGRPPSFAELIGPFIPEGMRMHVVGGVADRSAIYPKVARAADFSWINLQVDAFARQRALAAGQEPEIVPTPRFDRIYGQGHGAFVRDIYSRATNLQDIDQMVDYFENDDDYDYSSRELYTLYFSPEVA
jgi:hypothetical protein